MGMNMEQVKWSVKLSFTHCSLCLVKKSEKLIFSVSLPMFSRKIDICNLSETFQPAYLNFIGCFIAQTQNSANPITLCFAVKYFSQKYCLKLSQNKIFKFKSVTFEFALSIPNSGKLWKSDFYQNLAQNKFYRIGSSSDVSPVFQIPF